MLTESRSFILDLWGRVWSSLSSHCRWKKAQEVTVTTPVDSQASPPQNNSVFSESLNLYSLSTYTVSDKFLNEYHRPNRWRITQTQIRNTRVLVKCPGECLFPAHFLCWPPVLFLVTSSTHWLQRPSCWWHSNLHPNPDFYPIPQNSKLTFTTVYIFTVTPQPFLFKEVQDRNSIFPTSIPSYSFSRIPHVSK